LTHRERVWSCVHPDTFKYTLHRDEVLGVWRHLAARYGAPAGPSSFGVVEIHTDRFWIRAPRLMNPITLVRRRACTAADIDEFHALVRFEPPAAAHAA